jgi:peptidoglycan/LPS O-acetylase OafA/YrhL
MLTCYFGKKAIWWGPYNTHITVFSYGLIPIALCFLIMHLVVSQKNNLKIFLSSDIMKSLGVLSFGIYLWHVFCMLYIMNFQVARMDFEKN